jgi:hypothetical protein
MSVIVSLIGPIEHWWDTPKDPDRFMSATARGYRNWREHVGHMLVKAGCLVYRPHEGFKGPWDERAQVFNDEMIRISDVVVCLRPPGVPGSGTDKELALAAQLGKPVVHLPPGSPFSPDIVKGAATMTSTVSTIRRTVEVWITDESTELRPGILDEIAVASHNALDEVAKRFQDVDAGLDVIVR